MLFMSLLLFVLVVYDDEAVEKMLDRDLEDDTVAADEGENAAKGGLNDYLRSFKVATYRVKEGGDEEVRQWMSEKLAVDNCKYCEFCISLNRILTECSRCLQ